MTYIQLGTHQAPEASGSNQTTAGSPGISNDGITWPYDPNGQTPDFQINWNSNPPPTAQQVEATYEALINWLKNNTGSPAFYNGSIMLLQMTVDIGQHMGSFSSSDQAQLSNFLSNQINTSSGQTFLQMIIQIAAEGTAVSSSNGQTGYANAQAFLNELANASSALSKFGAPFTTIYGETQSELSTDPNSTDSIYNWIFGSAAANIPAHWGTIAVGGSPNGGTINAWVDDEGPNPTDNTINGQQAMTFEEFTEYAQFALGTAINPPTTPNPSVDGTIDAYYQSQIQSLVAEFKGNPWALLAALMNLINERDQDNGTAVNGYGGTLDQIKTLNGIVQKMIGDISGTTPNTADFYTQLAQLKQLALNDPALAGVASQLESDIGTINGQTVNFGQLSPPVTTLSWSVQAGYYNFPPGSTIQVNNITMTVPADGVIYIPKNSNITLKTGDPGNTSTYSFGQLAAMGNTGAIQTQMEAWTNPDNTTPSGNTNWSGTVMSNFENSVTGMQTLLNSPSASLQAQIQNMTQTMQAEENFEKEAYDSITNVNTQVMKLVQSVMG